MASVPADYLERAYAGVLGKLICVYLGRPFEGWTYQRIMKELGPIEYYVHDRFDAPLVVTDDDVACRASRPSATPSKATCFPSSRARSRVGRR